MLDPLKLNNSLIKELIDLPRAERSQKWHYMMSLLVFLPIEYSMNFSHRVCHEKNLKILSGSIVQS